MTATERAARKAERAASAARIAIANAEAAAALASNCCPRCGAEVRRNLAIYGWVQCAQYGASYNRANPDAPACSWQGFHK